MILALLQAAPITDGNFPWAGLGTGGALVLFAYVMLKVLEFLKTERTNVLAFITDMRERADKRDEALQVRNDARATLFAETVRGMADRYTESCFELSKACHAIQLEVKSAIDKNTATLHVIHEDAEETKVVLQTTKAVLGQLERRKEPRHG